RDAYYLGMDALSRHKHDEAIEWFLKHVDTSGSKEDIYRSWCRIAECLAFKKEYSKAIIATDNANRLKPHFPDAYYIKTLIYGLMQQYHHAIEWYTVGESKPEPITMHMIDPTLYQYRAAAMAAQ